MPFTLEKPYRTRDGQRAWAVRSPEPFNTDYRILGWFEYGDGRRESATWREDGRFYDDSSSGFDLVNATERITGWAAIHTAFAVDTVHKRLPFYVGDIYPTRKAAVDVTEGGSPPFAIVKLEFEDERQAGVGGGT